MSPATLVLSVCAWMVVLAGCDRNIRLAEVFSGGPAYTVTNTFGQLVEVSPAVAAHYVTLELAGADAATPVLTPTSGTIAFHADLDGLDNCLVLQPKLRDRDEATPLEDLGPDMARARKLRLDPDWSSFGTAAGGVLRIAAFEERGGSRIYVNPLPYLAAIPFDPGASRIRPPTFAEIRCESASDSAFATNVRQYEWAILSPTGLDPDEPLGGFLRCFFRLETEIDDGGGPQPPVTPWQVGYELREVGSGTVMSHGRYLASAFPVDGSAIQDAAETLGTALFRSPGDDPDPVTDLASDQLWHVLPLDPVPPEGDPVEARNLFDPATYDVLFDLDAEDAPSVRVYPPGDYELELTLHHPFSTTSSDSALVTFALGGAPQAILDAGVPDADEENPGVPIRLNDDNDNDNVYGPVIPPPAGSFELEPVVDLDEEAFIAGEDDLVQLMIDVVPHTLTNDLQLTIPSGGAAIRLWPIPQKGPVADEILVPPGGLAVPQADLPMVIFIEGVQLGSERIEIEVTDGPLTLTDAINLDVVRLSSEQEWTILGATQTLPRVINRSAIDTIFEVVGPAGMLHTFEWDINGDGTFATDPFELGSTHIQTVQYSPAADGATNVQLPTNAGNRRHTIEVAVRLNGGLILRRTERIALTDYVGTALTGVSHVDRQTEILTLGSVPVPLFDNTPPGNSLVWGSQDWHVTNFGINLPINSNRLQYAPGAGGGTNGIATHNGYDPTNPLPNQRELYLVGVGLTPYLDNQTQEAVALTIEHELLHVEQTVAIRDNAPANNVWRLLDAHFNNFGLYESVLEAHGHGHETLDSNIDFFHLVEGQNDLPSYAIRYNQSVALLGSIVGNAPLQSALRDLLRDWYQNLAFEEMRDTRYDWHVRPPP